MSIQKHNVDKLEEEKKIENVKIIIYFTRLIGHRCAKIVYSTVNEPNKRYIKHFQMVFVFI